MPIPLLVPNAAKTQAKELGATWDPKQRAWMWPDDSPRGSVTSWLPRIYLPQAKSPYILPKMIPRSTFGVNLRSLIPEEWGRISREFREKFGKRCQVCGGVLVECHEDWEYIFDSSAKSGDGLQRLRRLACLCRNCHAVKHLGKTGLRSKTEAAMKHLAAVNGWPVQKAYEESDKAWADWERRNNFRWTLDVSFAEQEYGLQIDVSSERIAAIQSEAGKKFVRPHEEFKPVASSVELIVPTVRRSPAIVVEHSPLQAYPIYLSHGTGMSSPSSGPGWLTLVIVALLGGVVGLLAFVRLSP